MTENKAATKYLDQGESDNNQKKITVSLDGRAAEILKRWRGERNAKVALLGLLEVADEELSRQQQAKVSSPNIETKGITK